MDYKKRLAFAWLVGTSFAALGTVAALAADVPAAAPDATHFDVMPYVNPQFRGMAGMVQKMGSGAISLENLPKIRTMMPPPPPLADPAWQEKLVPGPAGAPEVRTYLINADGARPGRPAILHLHGGGYILGDAKSGISALQPIAKALDCVIVTVDYRLAPETKFPGSLEDNYAALRWLFQHATELGVDTNRIAVMGESAGGGHAAMLAIAARDRGEFHLKFQALVYPMLDDRTGSTRKAPPYQGAIVWTPESNRLGWTSLLGVPAGSKTVPRGSVPARLTDLHGLPPAFIGVGSIDLFVDEDIDYARRLIDAGIPVDLQVVPGGFHGFNMVKGSSIADQFNADLLDSLKQAFAVAP